MRPSSLRPRMLLLALGLLSAGCAGNRQEQRLEAEAAKFIYVAPPPKVWAEAKALLKARGFTVNEDQAGRYVMSTPWTEVYASEDMGTQLRRFLVVGKDMGQGRFIVRIYNINYTTVGNVDSHPSMGNHEYQRDSGSSGGGGGGGMIFSKKGQGAAPAKGWYQRDLAMEWHLLERLEPELAEELKHEDAPKPTATALRSTTTNQ
ncbi:hypothetical protein FGE12_11120 [Aggregicoccus sp. 17bor-14]|uniref:hypothetical protein n=1 Tax=Myxococcaceae TaxID=31 RepID=UPI00129CAE4B|nr:MULTISPECIES: hypothetical protein [Myxococcaceae]MBF5042940.1 hypothetical protein [Simulacricoccus sp. 17bor-14]MRI88706.1 hypothetical protein [Aggregicoccus sp. 17bor-14]